MVKKPMESATKEENSHIEAPDNTPVNVVKIDTAKVRPVVRDALYEIAHIRSVMTDGKRNIRVLLKTLSVNLTPDQIEAVKTGLFEIVDSSTKTEPETVA